jgi:hypothetical protein
VREPGGELADRQQLLAIALDPLDRVADGLEHGQERAQQRRVREGQAAQLLAVELEHERVGDGERGAAVGRLGEQRHGAEVAARTVVEHDHLLAGDLARRLEPAVEDDVEGAREVSLAEEELARGEPALAPKARQALELVGAEAGEDRDVAQPVGGHRAHRPTLVDPLARSGRVPCRTWLARGSTTPPA